MFLNLKIYFLDGDHLTYKNFIYDFSNIFIYVEWPGVAQISILFICYYNNNVIMIYIIYI